MSELLEYYPLSLMPMANPNVDEGEHQVLDAQSAYVFQIHGSRDRAEAIVSILNERASGSAAQGTVHVGWAEADYQRARDCMMGILSNSGRLTSDIEKKAFDNAFQHAVGILALNAKASQVTEGMRAPAATEHELLMQATVASGTVLYEPQPVAASVVKALEPFAKAADLFDTNPSFYGDGVKLGTDAITVGDLRNARAALTAARDTEGKGILWCCHARGPDDVYAAPNYETALVWADALNETNWQASNGLTITDPKSFEDCLIKAVPAIWPHSPESHAEDLPRSIAGFTGPEQVSELDSLVGEHVLDAVDLFADNIKATWGDRFEHCEMIRFRLDGKVYTGIEDPDDGYRSSLRGLYVSEDPVSNVFPPVRVLAKMKGGETYQQNDTLQLVDMVTGKIVLEVGTDNTDDYYPWFVGTFSPENMATNEPTQVPRQDQA